VQRRGFTVIYTAIVTFIILKVLDGDGPAGHRGRRAVGLDLAQHNERGYNL
jgi:Amt family ammonium transporter